jgi:putative ABC transport system ATP-binding protein
VRLRAAQRPADAAPAADVPVIRMRGAGRTYPGPPPVRALHDVDLVVEAGEYVAVTGPSGAGKSTLLNLLGLLDRLSEGTFELDGIDVSGLPEGGRSALRGARIGFVFQSFHLLPHRTAAENVMLAQVYSHRPHASRAGAAAAALTRVGLAHRMHALPTTLSGGERQRVAIARAVVNMPRLLLCDEPTGNLDSAATGAVLDLIGSLNGLGLTVIVITHNPSVAARTRRAISILDGRIVADSGTGTRPERASARQQAPC